jgi:cytochrome c biogenesis protein
LTAKKETFFQTFWNFFCSLKLTISTLILLALTSIIGTVIQQNRPAAEYVQEYGEATFRFLTALQLTDMYHSWWFLGLLVMFCLNLIACSINRLPRVWKSIREPVLVPDEKHFRNSTNADEILVVAPPGKVREQDHPAHLHPHRSEIPAAGRGRLRHPLRLPRNDLGATAPR